MTPRRALEWIYSLPRFNRGETLEPVRELLTALREPQRALRFIHVAGTNGKGSISTMCASVLKEAGLRVGLYTSPFINDFRERFQVDGKPVSPAEFAAATREVALAMRGLSPAATLSQFDVVTAVGLLLFARAACDVLVLECGLGGRLDANPSYSLYKTLAAIRNVPFVPSPLADDFSWRKPVLEAAGGEKVSLFLLTNPNAPTGTVTPRETITSFAGKFKGVVIVDEAYADFAKSNCVSLATDAQNRNLIVMRTFSKSFSLAGLRVGYCIGPEDLIDALYKVKDSYNADAVAQSVALAALNDLPWMRKNAAKVKKTRTRVAKELARRGWDVLPSESNFLFARPAHRPAAELFDALRRMNIFVRYFKGARTGDRLRITIGTDAEMDVLLKALSSLDA